MASRRVLVAGASGYVGSRLVPELLARGHTVRCLARSPARLDAAPWRDAVEVVQGDVGGDLSTAMAGVDAAVYLVHSIGQSREWTAVERRHASNFRDAAAAGGVGRIVYLGGLGDDSAELSDHLRSRHVVGEVLAAGPVPVAELRAAVVIGSGSASFEMLRYLTEVLPVMVTPKWVRSRCQPIAIADVLRYLVEVIDADEAVRGVLEVGGPDVVSYAELMHVYAQEAGLRRRVLVPVPVLSPRLSSHWVGLVTPVPSSLARPLVGSLVNDVVVSDDRATRMFPFAPSPLREAVRRALDRGDAWPTDPDWSGGTELTDVRVQVVGAPVAAAWRAVCRVGGARGWYSGERLWQLRGWADRVLGGPGLRRARRDPEHLALGDPLDFWRVEEVDDLRRVVLRAEMKLPGEAWLEWALRPLGPGATEITQVARFRPRGLLGRVYWAVVAPFHRVVFPGLLAGIGRDAESLVHGSVRDAAPVSSSVTSL